MTTFQIMDLEDFELKLQEDEAFEKERDLQCDRNSPLLRLPAELRNIIFDLVIGGYKIHVCGRLLCHACCRRELGDDDAYKEYFDDVGSVNEVDGYPNPERAHPVYQPIHWPSDATALTTTCRQIRSETRLLPFALNIFYGHMMGLSVKFTGYCLNMRLLA
ncbi:hypothetical protein CC86DRAFT_401574 [Ophiobolus disseminans]|uniref:Uncharacterized protein n=1 Tax=Ophiobolus disseminans TaxID=1469910 RepID=A0A6A7ACY8_9PLEO|nr:hypothetical protein CC86DRAFT_401574 [Ophiobolus disseminans]